MRKHVKYGVIAGVFAAPLAVAAIVVPASASGGGDVSSAYGIAASGLLNIPRTPSVTAGSRPNTRSVVSIPGNPLVQLSVLRTRAVPGHAEASVVDLRIAKVAISPNAVLSAKLITAKCDDGVGQSRLVDVRLAGRAIQAGASPNSRITVPVEGLGGVQVTVNKQVRNPDGSVTVTALELAVRALGRSQAIAISSATCAGGEAPRPTPVPSDLPVTG
ncbi:MAG: choice-of-anchor P family protein [Actinoallomurus sp.]